MGLLDSILGSVMNSGGNNGGGNNALVQIAMQMLQGRGQSTGQAPAGADSMSDMGDMGGTSGEGLTGMLDAFKQGGLGHLADSWVSTGENLPVSGDQISQVLGEGKIGEIAGKLGISQGDVANGLSQLLPQLINHVTPNGQVPATSDLISSALSMFMKR